MIGFRENEEKNCNFVFAPPPQKVGKGAPITTIFFPSALKEYDEQLCQVLTM